MPTTTTSEGTAPAAIERALTLDILRGRYAASGRLPTVRELAVAHRVTPATIQRVVARLETRGLVTARQGSGLHVNDPATIGDLSLAPYWLEATLEEPARAVRILGDFLEVRRVVATRLMVRHRGEILAQAPVLAAAAEAMARASEGDLDALREADLGFARALLRATGNVVALGVLNTMARVLEEVPSVAEAMYAEPERNASSMSAVLQALIEVPKDLDARIEAAFVTVDERTLARFERLLRRRSSKGARA